MRLKLASALFLSIISCSATCADNEETTYVFTGKDGAKAEVLPLDDGEMLVRFSNTQTLLDGTPLLHRYDSYSATTMLYTTLYGRNFVSASLAYPDESYTSAPSELSVFSPKSANIVKLKYDSASTRTADSKAFLSDYKEAQDKGTIGQLKAYNRDKAIQLETNKFLAFAPFASKLEKTNAACGIPLKYNINWDSIQDAQLKDINFSAVKRCIGAIDGVKTLCENGSAEKVKAKTKEITCSAGSAQSLELKNNVLNYQFNTNGEQGQESLFVEAKLLEKL